MKKFNIGVIGIGDISKVYIINLQTYSSEVTALGCASRGLKKGKIMKKRIIATIMGLTMATTLLAGCGNSSSSSTSSENSNTEETTAEAASEDTETATTEDTSSDEELSIQVIVNTLSSEYWGYVQAGALAYNEDHPNVNVSVVGPTSETAYDEQQNMIETALSSGAYDGLVISALQTDTAANIIKDADIPIVSVNTNLDCEESLSFVGTGNEEAAKNGAIAAVEAAKEAGWDEVTAINIAGIQGDLTHTERTNGFQKGTEEAGGDFLEDEIQYADSVADKAVTSMEAIMLNHPEGISIIFCNNDDMAMAAARAAADNEAYANTIFCGFDGIISACESILEGEETMSIAQDPYGMGYKSVEACVAAINGETLDSFIDTGSSVITIDNAQEQLDTLNGYLGN